MALLRFSLMTLATFVLASTADAQVQYFLPFQHGAYYAPYNLPVYSSAPALPPSYSALPATNVPTVQPGQTLVPVTSADQTTPSLAVHHPGLGFIGWWQLIQGVWQFVDNRSNGNGGNGGDSTTVQQMKVQVDNNAAKIEQLHGKVDELLNRVPATRPVPPPSTPASNPPAAPSPAPTAAGRLDQIINRLGTIQFKQ